MLIGRFYKAKFWNSVENVYESVFVELVETASGTISNIHFEGKIIVGDKKGAVVSINRRYVEEEYHNEALLINKYPEYFI